MPFVSQKFIDTRTGEIVTQVPLSQIAHFEEYNGPLQAGDFDTTKTKAPAPRCNCNDPEIAQYGPTMPGHWFGCPARGGAK